MINTVSGAVAGTVDVVAASNTAISDGTCGTVVGAVAMVWVATVLAGPSGGSVVVELATAFGGSRVLSVPCESPPVVSITTTIASTIAVAAPATKIIDRESFHQLPVGSSYSQATSVDSLAGGGPPGWCDQSPLLLSLTS